MAGSHEQAEACGLGGGGDGEVVEVAAGGWGVIASVRTYFAICSRRPSVCSTWDANSRLSGSVWWR